MMVAANDSDYFAIILRSETVVVVTILLVQYGDVWYTAESMTLAFVVIRGLLNDVSVEK